MNAIPFHDFGGTGELIHFAHANAYPPACYRAFIEPLTAQYRVMAIEQRPLWPNSNPAEMPNWQVAADDLIAFLDQQGAEGVIGMGHSLGAVATLFAALKRPSLFSRLILIEPVFLIFPPEMLQAMADNPELASLTPLVQVAMRRRNQWPTRQAAFDHFRVKSVFRNWLDEAMWDYVNNALVANADGITLRYSREWEAQFYATPPITVWEDIPRIQQPTLGLRGADTNTIFPQAWQRWQELQPSATFLQVEEAGHMIPMERPFFLANTILEYLS